MGVTEEILSPIRLSNTHPRATQEGTTVMRRCETPQMPLHPAKCSGGLTALRTNTLTARATVERRLSTHTGPGTGKEGPVFPHKKTLTTTVPFIAPTHILTQARHLTQPMSQGKTGQNTSALLGRSTITIAGQRSPSGRNPKSGWNESTDRKRPLRPPS